MLRFAVITVNKHLTILLLYLAASQIYSNYLKHEFMCEQKKQNVSYTYRMKYEVSLLINILDNSEAHPWHICTMFSLMELTDYFSQLSLLSIINKNNG